MSACSTCGADIVWAITPTGARMPLDALPVPRDGAVLAARRVGAGRPLSVRPLSADADLWPDEHPARSHFATCQHADTHRKSR